jgi:hypothetical protein
MKKEKLQEYALLAEIISALAVVLSLIFVGMGIRQSTHESALNRNVAEVSAYQDLVGQVLELNYIVINNPELAELLNAESLQNLTSAERSSLTRHYANLLRHADLAMYQYDKGLIDQCRLYNILGVYRLTLNNEGFREFVQQLTGDLEAVIEKAYEGEEDCQVFSVF